MRRAIPALAVFAALLASAAAALATTGSTIGFPQPKVDVPVSTATPFEGRYILRGVGRGANIRSGEMKIEFSEGGSPAFLAGALEFYEYNSSGQTEIALLSLYPFTTSNDGLQTGILQQGITGGIGQDTQLGNLDLATPKSESAPLTGELRLHGAGPFPVVFSRLGEDEKTNGNPPPAEQISEAGSEPTASGWGADPSEYEGEYELSNPVPDPTDGAGVLAPVIGVAQRVGSSTAGASGGSMKVGGGDRPTAVATIESGGSSQTFYLTDLAWKGDLRVAKVRRGSVTGQVIGEFEGTQSSDLLKGTLEAGESRFEVNFERNAQGGSSEAE